MTNIKVQYQAIVEFLEANKGKKVSTIMDEVIAMCEAKKGGSNGQTFIRDEDGNVTKVFCYYHKKWEDVATVEFGVKKNTATGLNTMCKEGVSNWTKQQRIAKQEEAKLLDKLVNGELTQDGLQEAREAIDATRQAIMARQDGQGSDEA